MPKIKESEVNIYIIDDDEMLLKILKNKFSTCTGYKLYTYTDGVKFIEEYTKFPFSKRQIHIVILDYMLTTTGKSDDNGLVILKKIKAINSDVDVIMLSGIEDVDVATTAIKSGAVSYIKKNENSYLRIQNQVKYIISQKMLSRSRTHNKYARNLFLLAMAILFGFGIIVLFLEILQ